jgi:hypothetical protein
MGNMDLERVGDRSQQAPRQMEYQAERKARLDGDRRIDRLTAPLSGGRRQPSRYGLLGNPHRQASALDQRGVVFRPVRDPVFGPGDLVAESARMAASRIPRP